MKKRGRPRAFDPDAALASARGAFWDAGFAATSLDTLSAATGMNRPSLYGAFGDKQALYLKTLELYRDESLAGLAEALDPARPLREGLAAVYAGAIDLYLDGDSGARGCFLIGTATTEAVQQPAVQAALHQSLLAFDQVVEDRFRLARDQGELDPDVDVPGLAKLAGSIMHSLAVRARAGEPRAALEALAATAVAMICRR